MVHVAIYFSWLIRSLVKQLDKLIGTDLAILILVESLEEVSTHVLRDATVEGEE